MSTPRTASSGVQSKLLWAGVVVLGTVALGVIALNRGESVNAAWLVIAAVCIYFIAYRFYGLYITSKVLRPAAMVKR
jgi:carbon starvation protein